MRQSECCKTYKQMNYNYCPECGIYIGKVAYNLFEPATLTEDIDSARNDDMKESHPSYAQLKISRISGSNEGRKPLFGSTIRHQHTITLQIHSADKIYNQYHERYFGCGIPYIEIEMSQSQFAEAITSMNMGSGIPVTLRYLMGKPIPFCEELTMRQKVDGNIKTNFKNIINKIKQSHIRIKELSEQKGPLKASEKSELIGLSQSLIMEIESNLPFFKQTIDETVDQSVTQAKSEIDATMQHVIARLGMEKLAEITGNSSLLLGEE